MYYGKKKGIIIAVIIVILAILLVAGGLVVYLTTDLFKSNETLFLKYIGKQYESIYENPTSAKMQQMLNTANQSNTQVSESSANISFSYIGNTNLSEAINAQLQKAKINIVKREDKQNNKVYSNIKIDYDNDNLVDIHYGNSNDIFALKWEDIVQAYYVGVKNENLKVFAQKLGVQDTTQIPDKLDINNIDFSEILSITDEEKNHIKEVCINVLLDNISPDKYTKQKDMVVSKNGQNYDTTAYRLDLSAEEIKNIVVKMLEALRDDSITLNLLTTKAKLLNLNEEFTTIDGVRQKIQDQVNKISSSTVDNSKGLSIAVYEYKGKTIQTEIILKNEIKLTISSSDENAVQSIRIVADNLSEEQDYTTIVIDYKLQATDTNNAVSINVNVDNTNTYTINISNTGTASSENGIQTMANVILANQSGSTFEIVYEAQKVFGKLTQEIEELGNNNTATLNNYDTENLNSLIAAISERLEVVVNEKMQKIAPLIQTVMANMIQDKFSDDNVVEDSTSSLQEQEKEAFNARFEAYIGDDLSSAITKSLCDLVDSNNSSSEHVITINGVTDTNGIENLKKLITPEIKYKTTATYNEQGYMDTITIYES